MDRNELDPSVPSATEVKKIPLIIKVYAVLCILSGVGTLPSVAVFMWQVITALINGNAAAKLGDNTLVAVGLIVAGIMLSAAMICASTTLVSSMQNFVLRCAIHIDGDWYGAVYDAAYKDYEDIRDSDRVSSAAYAQVLGYAKIDSANERKPYLYVLGGDVASGYFKTMPVHLILGTLPKDSTEIILPEHLTSNGKVNYKLGDTVTLDVGDRTLDGRRLGQDTPVYTYDSETQVAIMSGDRL